VNHNYKIVNWIVQTQTLWSSNNDDAQLKPWNLDVNRCQGWLLKEQGIKFQLPTSDSLWATNINPLQIIWSTKFYFLTTYIFLWTFKNWESSNHKPSLLIFEVQTTFKFIEVTCVASALLSIRSFEILFSILILNNPMF
jgi:hypothetical protein